MKIFVSFHMKDNTIRTKTFEDTQVTYTRPVNHQRSTYDTYIFRRPYDRGNTPRLIEEVITHTATQKFHDYLQNHQYTFEEGLAKIVYSAEALNFYSYVEVTDDLETSSDESSL